MESWTVDLILTEDLVMREICAKMVPKNLSEQQQDAQRNLAADLLDYIELNPVLTHLWWASDHNIVLFSMIYRQTRKLQVIFNEITMSKGSSYVKIKNEMHAYVILWVQEHCWQNEHVSCTNNYFLFKSVQIINQ